MLTKIYEKILEKNIKKVPKHIVIISPEITDEFVKFVKWCKKFGISEITICVHNSISISPIKGAKMRIVENGKVREIGFGNITINVILGYSGKEEIVNAIKKLADMVLKGELDPKEIGERHFEELLAIRSQPDMIIKVGNEIPEFLIWQGIYSELYFADIDWKTLRYVDFLRFLREYQRRERRYGR